MRPEPSRSSNTEGFPIAEATNIGHRHAVLQEVNDFVLGLQLRFGTSRSERVGFLCECEDARCTELVMLTCNGYEALRRDGGQVLARGHVHDAA
jgi:hypothetical protein